MPVAASAADGSFTIERAPRHYGLLSAEAGDFGGEITQTAARPVIRLMPRPLVSGTVRDAEGRPLRGIALTLTSEHRDVVAVSDAGGHFAMHVAPGTYEASSDSASYRLRNAKVHVHEPIVRDLVAIAETGMISITENEGNARLTAALPKVLISLLGIEKILPRLEDLALFLPMLATAGTGQPLTCYNSMYGGPKQPGETDGPEEYHVVLLDNHRTALLADAEQRGPAQIAPVGFAHRQGADL